jgi:NADH-quinone oxidoreductase subunit M
MAHPLLILVAVPLAAAVLLGVLPRARPPVVRLVTIAATALVVAVSFPLWFSFEPRGAQWQFVDHIERAGWRLVMAADGFGLAFILLAALVSFAAAVLLAHQDPQRPRPWALALLLIEAGTLGAIVSLELRQMFLFWQMAVVAMAAMTMLAGAKRTAVVLSAVAVVAGAAMFSGLLALGEQYRELASVVSFDVREFHTMPVRTPVQMQAFVLLAAGCLLPLVVAGAHAWSTARNTDVDQEATGLLSSMLLVQLTVFGLLRVVLPSAPQAARTFAGALVIAGLIAAVLSVGLAVVSRARRAVFWVALGQTLIAMVGLFAASPAAVSGAAVQLTAAGLAMAMLLAVTETRTARDASRRMDVLTVVAVLVAIGGGATGARLITAGIAPFGTAAALAVVLASAVSAIALVSIGWRQPASSSLTAAGRGLGATALAAALGGLLLAIAIHPAPLLSRLETSVARLIVRVSPEYSSQVADCLNQPPPSTPPDSGLPPGAMLAAPCKDVPGKTPAPNKNR